MRPSIHPDDRKLAIAQCYVDGKSLLEIASLYTTTKSTIAGIVDRLVKKGLIERRPPVIEADGRLRRTVQLRPKSDQTGGVVGIRPPFIAKAPSVGKQTLHLSDEPAAPEDEPAPPPPPPRRPDADEMRYQCQWVTGDRQHGQPWRHCGKPCSKPPYCTKHADIAYVKRRIPEGSSLHR